MNLIPHAKQFIGFTAVDRLRVFIFAFTFEPPELGVSGHLGMISLPPQRDPYVLIALFSSVPQTPPTECVLSFCGEARVIGETFND